MIQLIKIILDFFPIDKAIKKVANQTRMRFNIKNFDQYISY